MASATIQKINNLHCGACGENFEDIKLLANHLDCCIAAKVLLPLIHKVVFFKLDKTGHPVAHFINILAKNNHIIKKYAYSIADEIGTFERSKIHYELCEKLDLNYNKFRPFESSDIKEKPNRYEAECLLWKALEIEANKKLELLGKV